MSTMNLADIDLPQESVGIPGTGGKSFGVEALSFKDIVALFLRNKEVMGELYLRFVSTDTTKPKVVKAALGTLIKDAPEIVAAVISMASGNGFQIVEKVIKMPFTVQVEALEKIATLTFGRLEDGAVKKFMQTVVDALEVFNELMTEAAQLPKAGSVKSDAT